VKIQRNAEAQSRIIEDLLDVSRIISGKLRIELRPVSLPTIVETVVNGMRPSADAKDLTLTAKLDATAGPILGDPTRLQQIATNLLSNAIKFTPEGGSVEVRLYRSDSHVRLQIVDSGIGIGAEDLPHIFERFKQADSSNIRAHSGLGLGLAIVDHLVRQQNGAVHAQSEGAERGATFTVDFPLAPTEVIDDPLARVNLFSEQAQLDLAESEAFADQVSLAGIRVLLVEDDRDTRELLRTVLERCGAEVTAVASSSAALAAMGSVKPAVLISDIGMPGENGYDLIQKIRALKPEEGGRVPAVALTAYAAAADRRRALLAGFQTHLAKPVEPDELLAVIASLSAQPEAG
jgi:CheY-like chemotaxis protein